MSIDRNMQFTPYKALAICTMFLRIPLAFAEDVQARRVDSQVLNGAASLGFKSNIDSFCTFADATVSGHKSKISVSLNTELITSCMARGGIEKTRLTISAMVVAK